MFKSVTFEYRRLWLSGDWLRVVVPAAAFSLVYLYSELNHPTGPAASSDEQWRRILYIYLLGQSLLTLPIAAYWVMLQVMRRERQAHVTVQIHLRKTIWVYLHRAVGVSLLTGLAAMVGYAVLFAGAEVVCQFVPHYYACGAPPPWQMVLVGGYYLGFVPMLLWIQCLFFLTDSDGLATGITFGTYLLSLVLVFTSLGQYSPIGPLFLHELGILQWLVTDTEFTPIAIRITVIWISFTLAATIVLGGVIVSRQTQEDIL